MTDIIRLDHNTPSIQYLCQKDKRLAKIINLIGPINYLPHSEDSYAFLVHEIIEQMLSVKAGQKIYTRLNDLCNGIIEPEVINTLSDKQLRSIGTSTSKARCIRDMTTSIITNELNLEILKNLSDQDVINCLTQINGIGNWTAKMYLIFVLDRPDILPIEDGAFLQVYRWIYKTTDCREESVIKKCNKWKPYSSIASRYFYKALDAGMTKEAFHLYKK